MATNDLADLNSKLDTQLKDTSDTTWGSAEKDEIIKEVVQNLWPRFSRPIDPNATTSKITVVANTYYYDLPAGMYAVSRVDLFASDGTDYGPLHAGAWEIVDDVLGGTGQLHIAQTVAEAGDVLHLHGYGAYDTTTNLAPFNLTQLILAQARAEAYRRITADREQFKVWLARNQNQNVSVNEMLQMIGEAQREAERLWQRTPKTFQRPVRGRIG